MRELVMHRKLELLPVILAALMALATAPAVGQRIPDWLVGRYEGYSRRDARTVALRISNSGGVTVIGRGPLAGERSYASFSNGILYIDKDRYTVERTRDGFRAVPYYDRDNE